jgi:polyhydroxyalkanoate synthase subunit PhaC
METTTTRPNRTEPDPRRRTSNDPAPQSESDALASVEGGEPVALPTPRGVVRGLVATFARPRPLARETARLGRDSVRILRGTDEIAPSPKDKRFADPAWWQHPGYRRLAQSYVAWSDALHRLVDDYESGGPDWREVEQARFVLDACVSALAPPTRCSATRRR